MKKLIATLTAAAALLGAATAEAGPVRVIMLEHDIRNGEPVPQMNAYVHQLDVRMWNLTFTSGFPSGTPAYRCYVYGGTLVWELDWLVCKDVTLP